MEEEGGASVEEEEEEMEECMVVAGGEEEPISMEGGEEEEGGGGLAGEKEGGAVGFGSGFGMGGWVEEAGEKGIKDTQRLYSPMPYSSVFEPPFPSLSPTHPPTHPPTFLQPQVHQGHEFLNVVLNHRGDLRRFPRPEDELGLLGVVGGGKDGQLERNLSLQGGWVCGCVVWVDEGGRGG